MNKFYCKGKLQGYDICSKQCDECNPNVDFEQTENEDKLVDEMVNEIIRIPFWVDVPKYVKTNFTITKK